MCGRAGDEAREATREGLWTWRSDPSAYWAQRRLSDPTVAIRRKHRKGHRRTWFVEFDNGVRHCRQMESLVVQETSLLHSLLNAASTIAVTRDARAQETFNLLAGVGAVLLGLPALVVSLYGAADVLPVYSHWRTLIPIGVSGLLASIVAARLPGRRRQRLSRFGITAAGTLVILMVLVCAGMLVEPTGGTGSVGNQPSPTTSK